MGKRQAKDMAAPVDPPLRRSTRAIKEAPDYTATKIIGDAAFADNSDCGAGDDRSAKRARTARKGKPEAADKNANYAGRDPDDSAAAAVDEPDKSDKRGEVDKPKPVPRGMKRYTPKPYGDVPTTIKTPTEALQHFYDSNPNLNWIIDTTDIADDESAQYWSDKVVDCCAAIMDNSTQPAYKDVCGQNKKKNGTALYIGEKWTKEEILARCIVVFENLKKWSKDGPSLSRHDDPSWDEDAGKRKERKGKKTATVWVRVEGTEKEYREETRYVDSWHDMPMKTRVDLMITSVRLNKNVAGDVMNTSQTQEKWFTTPELLLDLKKEYASGNKGRSLEGKEAAEAKRKQKAGAKAAAEAASDADDEDEAVDPAGPTATMPTPAMTPGDGEDVVSSVEPTAESSQKHTQAASETTAKRKRGKKAKTTEEHAAVADEPDTITLKTPTDHLLDLSASLSLNSGPLSRENTDTQQMDFTMQTPAPEGHATLPDCLSGHGSPQPQQSAAYQQSGRMHHLHGDAYNTDLRINSTNRDAALFSDRNVGFEDGSAYFHTNQDVTQSPAEHRTSIQSSYPPLQQYESRTGPYYTNVPMQDTFPVDGSFSDMYGTLGGTDDGNNSPNPFALSFDKSDYFK